MFILVDSAYSTYTIESTTFKEHTETSYVDSTFTSATMTETGGDVVLVGYAGDVAYGDLIISRYDSVEDKFYSVVYDNYLTNSVAASSMSIYPASLVGTYYLAANVNDSYVEFMKFDFDASTPVISWQKSFSDTTNKMFASIIQADAAGNLVFFLVR